LPRGSDTTIVDAVGSGEEQHNPHSKSGQRSGTVEGKPLTGADEPTESPQRGNPLLMHSRGTAQGMIAPMAELQRVRDAKPQGPIVDRVMVAADSALVRKPASVMDKTMAPPSGDKHDYMSIGIYWWPDPTKPDGLPWVRRDGKVNPDTMEGVATDGGTLQRMARDVETLTAAWWLSDDHRYADQAALLLRTWFLDPATRMNPHLRYGQGVPGKSEGREFGIITGVHFMPLLDAVQLLRNSPAWTDADDAAFRQWFARYLDWLKTSPFGKRIAQAANNHATWYAVQTHRIQAFVSPEAVGAGKPLAASLVAAFDRRMEAFAADGSQPEELGRTLSLTYSMYNLYAQATLARLGEAHGLDLWRRDPRLAAAFDFVAPAFAEPPVWLHQQIEPFKVDQARPPLILGGHGLGRPDLLDTAQRLAADAVHLGLLDIAALATQLPEPASRP
jgi:hypothetical protein